MEQVEGKIPRISVIVPVYNVEDYLGDCVNSLLSQTFTDIEILLVNDGSTDNSPALCEEYGKRDARVRNFSQENRGLSAARNFGIDHARAPWLMFVDSDDFVEPDFCEYAISAVEENRCQIAVFSYERVGLEWKDPMLELPEQYLGRIERSQALSLLAWERIQDYAWNKIYARSLFEGVRYPEGEIFEDIATTCRLFDRAEAVYISKKRLYWYRWRQGSIMSACYPDILQDKIKQREKEYAFLLEHCPEAAPGTERALFIDELDACSGDVINPDRQERYREMKRRLLSRRHVWKKYGFKKAVYITALKISDRLFAQITGRRRKRMGL